MAGNREGKGGCGKWVWSKLGGWEFLAVIQQLPRDSGRGPWQLASSLSVHKSDTELRVADLISIASAQLLKNLQNVDIALMNFLRNIKENTTKTLEKKELECN